MRTGYDTENHWRSARQPIKQTTLHGQVVSKLREMIVNAELAPGIRVPEKDLCAYFGISRTPLREALKVLASEGLVALEPNRGATVTTPTVAMVADRFEVIAALEGFAARLFCERGSEEQLNELQRLHDDMMRCHAAQELAGYFDANQRFHELLVASCNNPILSEMQTQASVHLRRVRYHSIVLVDPSQRFVRQHARIMHALATRNGSVAQRAMQDHNRSLSLFVQDALRKQAAQLG